MTAWGKRHVAVSIALKVEMVTSVAEWTFLHLFICLVVHAFICLSVVLWYILGWGNCGVVSSPYLLYLAGCKTVTIFTSTNFHRMNEILHASSHCEPLETGYSLWCLASVFTTYIITLFVQWLHTEMTNSSTCSGLPFLSGTWLALFVCVCVAVCSKHSPWILFGTGMVLLAALSSYTSYSAVGWQCVI